MIHPLSTRPRRRRDRVRHSPQRSLRRRLRLETLETRVYLASDLVISEFLARNESGLTDEDGDRSDWVEIQNTSSAAIDLNGYYLSDNASNLTKWQFPAVTLPAGGFLTVFASSKDRDDPLAPLHANFALSGDGEFLGLIAPDGSTIVDQFAPTFPPQYSDISYGRQQQTTHLVSEGHTARYFVPTVAQSGLGTQWTQSGFNHNSWSTGPTGLGFGLVEAGFSVRMIDVEGGTNGTLDSATEAKNVLDGIATPGEYLITFDQTATVGTVNFAGGAGSFGGDRPYLDGTNDTELSDIAMRATAIVTIPVGTWTIGFGSDDGGALRLAGVTFTGEANTNGDTPGDGEIRFEGPRGHAWTSGQFTVTGSPLTTTLEAWFFERGGGDSWEVAIRSGPGNNTYVASGTLLADGALGWSVVTPTSVGAATNVQSSMQGTNATLWTRIPFEVDDEVDFQALFLRMHYNDGFVAYLNGQEIARRNAPASLNWNSTATASRTPTQTSQAEDINITSFKSLLQPGTNVLAIQGLNITAGDSSFLVLPELIGVETTDDVRFFLDPTPTAANTSGIIDFVSPLEFSVPRGFKDAPFQLSLTTQTPGATIRYTLDGTPPSTTHGTVYTGPLTIDSTSNVRAFAYRDNYEPSPVETHSYIFIADVLQQSPTGQAPTGFPTGPINGQVIDYGMDPEIVNHPTWGPQLPAALVDIPSLSITMDIDDLLGPSQGIFVNAGQRGRAWERPFSLELIDPSGLEEGFQIDAGLRIRGGFSRSNSNPKHSFRVFFRDDYGDGKLDYPLFGDEGVTIFDGIDFRTAQNYSWAFGGDNLNTINRDVFSRDVQREMGATYTRSRYYHLYINGQYWGIFQTQERSEADFAASYFGGEPDDWDTVKSAGSSAGYTIEATDGTLDAWQDLWNLINTIPYAPDQQTAYALFQQAQGNNPDGTRNPEYPVLLDVDNLAQYMLVIIYTGNKDAPISNFLGNDRVNNWFGVRDRTGEEGFKFFAHDNEHTLLIGDLNINRNGPWPAGYQFQYSSPQWLHQQLMAVDEYRVHFGDFVHKHMFNDGILTPQGASELFLSRAAEIEMAIIGESARWGDSKTAVPKTKDTWTTAVNNIVNQYFPQRHPIILNQFQNTVRWVDPMNSRTATVSAPLYPSVQAPVFAQRGGEVESGFEVLMSSSAPLIYYTLDGTDPRLVGGGISPSALAYDTSISPQTLVAEGSVWKYLDNGTDQGTVWIANGFDDSAWASGPAQLGYGDGDEATVVGFGGNAQNKHITTYFRHSFNVADTANITGLNLRVQRDDGAVIYINGQEVWRTNMPLTDINHQTLATGAVGGANENTFYEFAVSPALLQAGQNVIAVSVHQSDPASSDLSFDLSLEALVSNAVPPELTQSARVQARAYDNGQWSALDQAQFFIDTPAASGNLAITEIQYNPVGPTAAELAINAGFVAGDFEFVELRNVSSEIIDLTGVSFTSGISFDFSTAGSVSLQPGEYLVLAKRLDAFVARYGDSIPAIGPFSGALDNTGERLTLTDRFGEEILDFTYDDGGAWPSRADGGGSSLEIIDTAGDYNSGSNYRASTEYGGSPGQAGIGPVADILINEVLAHTDLPQVDSIELYNTTSQPIDISGWWLSDSATNYFAYQIPGDTVIAAGGYLVFDAYDFNTGAPGSFLLSSVGEEVWLLASDEQGTPSRFVDHVTFPGSPNGESFGRWPNGVGELYPMTELTLGSANSGPRIGPVIITEVMYAPPDPDGLGGIEPNNLEFVEIYNSTDSAVDLTNWRFTAGIDFGFAAGQMLAPRGTLVVVGFDPLDPLNAALVDEFRTFYGIDASVLLVGGFSGRLDNAGERVRLSRADDPPIETPDIIPMLIEDEVIYDELAPWPTSPDGLGDSLQRLSVDLWGNFASSWVATAPSPGVAFAGGPPRMGVNTGLTVAEGATQTITSAQLRYDDNEQTAAELTFTITMPPLVGRMELATQPGVPLNSFTQAQINAGAIRYVHDDSETTSDSFAFTVDDGDGNVLENQTFAIVITPVFDPPTAILLDNATVAENLPGILIGNLTVLDPDPGDSHQFTVTDARFSVVSQQLRLKPGVSLNYEVEPEVSFEIIATDAGGKFLAQLFTITVTNVNDPPTNITLGNATVLENAAGATIGALTVIDQDVGDVHTLTVDDARFEIAAGVLRLKPGVSLDHEATPSITLLVTAIDSSQASLQRSFELSVNNVNEPPTSVQLSNSTVAENAAGVSIGLLSATDPDVGNTHTFTLNDSRFEVLGNQLRLRPGQSLNFEASPTVTLAITARDNGTPQQQATFNVLLTVTNVNEPPSAVNLSRSDIFIGLAGAWIGEITVIDPELADTHSLTVLDSRFEIIDRNLYLKLGQAINGVAGQTLLVTIAATDNSGLSSSHIKALRLVDTPTDWECAYHWAPNPYDVNADGVVSPLDAILIINELNASGPRDLPPLPIGRAKPAFFDVACDAAVNTLDAVVVINVINSSSGTTGGEPAGEFTEPDPSALLPSQKAAIVEHAFGAIAEAGFAENSVAVPVAALEDPLAHHARPSPALADEIDWFASWSALDSVESYLPHHEPLTPERAIAVFGASEDSETDDWWSAWFEE